MNDDKIICNPLDSMTVWEAYNLGREHGRAEFREAQVAAKGDMVFNCPPVCGLCSRVHKPEDPCETVKIKGLEDTFEAQALQDLKEQMDDAHDKAIKSHFLLM